MKTSYTIEQINKLEKDLHYIQEVVDALLDHAAVAFVVCDLQHRVQYMNQIFEQMFGWSKEELMGQPLPNMTPSELTTYSKLMAANNWEYDRMDFQRRHKNGLIIQVRETITPIQDQQGSIVAYASILWNIEDQIKSERSLKESRQQFQSLFDNNPDAVIALDLKGNLINVNPATQKLTGYTKEEFSKLTLTSLCVPEHLDRIIQRLERTMLGRPQNFEAAIFHKNGTRIELNLILVPISIDGEISGVYFIAKNITQRKEAEDLIQYMAYYDALTDLPNRRMFERKVTAFLNEADVHRSKIAILYLDLDGFKFINDSLGHGYGDQVLKEVAERLKRCLREHDTVGRMGGDEFTICLPYMNQYEDADPVSNRILNEIRKPFQLQGQDYYLSASIGIAFYPEHGTHAEDLIHNADTALYKVKEHGKNNVKMYSKSMNEEAVQRRRLENELHKALQLDEFILHYQPQIDVKTNSIIGMEALIRWEHPTRNLLYPNDFIALAEESGLIVPIGQKVLELACKQCKDWQEMGHTDLRIGVNLSQIQLRQPDLVESVRRVLEMTGLEPSFLELEITESIAMHNTDLVIEQLNGLVALGVQISIDDFGTGFSSLSYLSKFPIHRLKIDRSFITNITNKSESAIVSSIVGLAQNLNLGVIVEGVETELQRITLPALGCHEMQGYLFSRPMPAIQFGSILESRIG
ncbi:sensor domain-containing protein [Paenibacillus hexagrammi]|uniref:EAL domain-containing protein n=1 Tax=Paenibacillus hexagrammi TaxID=2908839 RepID=A0ABY3SPZ3_9BACL|nr:bifunctional diguanylate cyclase/phosphodiesterase [Paenibacillus sp. YPD9-1]UJF35912.1 EAL domain-containing protein [Paenibacillus sp. YPD9-1]